MNRVLRWGTLLLVPFVVRAIVHLELTSDPFYSYLFVDARIYHEIARVLADSSQAMTGPHWQPPFYPQFVAGVYRLVGPDPDAVRWVQMGLGSIGAVLTHGIARRIVSPAAAWVAWAVVSFSGPCVLFDLQILPASLAGFLLLTSIALLLPSRGDAGSGLAPTARTRAAGLTSGLAPAARTGAAGLASGLAAAARTGAAGLASGLAPAARTGAAGLASGLAALTVGNLLLLLPWFLGLTLWSIRRGRRSLSPGWSGYPWPAVLAFLVLWCLPLAVNTVQNYRVSGEVIPISYNGGINFWIGNNPEYAATVAIRPGRDWQALTREPIDAGATSYRAQSDYFVRRSVDWMLGNPVPALGLGLHKLRLFFRGDEIPRNQELYPFRTNSRLLSALLWVRGVAFPSGLVLPLAACGIVLALVPRGGFEWRPDLSSGRFLRALAVLTVLYSVSVVAFFVTARYRVPIYPVLACFAALAVVRMGASIRSGDARSRVVLLAGIGGLVLLSNLGLPRMTSEPGSDTHFDLGLAYQTEGDPGRAEDLYQKALAQSPQNAEAHNNLAGLRLRSGDLLGARVHLEAVLERYPDDVTARLNLTRVRLAAGDTRGAEEVLRPLRERMPGEVRVRALSDEIRRMTSESRENGGVPER